jgi:predicted ATPase
VTLTGLGGAGKTRLGIRVASGQLGRFPDGVWFVELAALTDPALVPQTVGEVLDLLREGLFSESEPWLERLARHLQDKRLLLVLDNCEHLITDCGRLAATLLSRCPHLCILATSRERLGVQGEGCTRCHLCPSPGRTKTCAARTRRSSIRCACSSIAPA